MRIYGNWAGNPQGNKEDPERCVVEVWPSERGGGFIPHQCGKKRGHGTGEYEGLLCAQHAAMQAKGRHLSVPEDK